jgi:large subunit ribosomal protein L9
MRVLLRVNVSKLGQIGEVVDVKPGYARNYLLPQGLATQPTEANLRKIEAEKEEYLAQLAKKRAELQQLADVIEGKEVTISARANTEGHLYGSVGPAQIAAALAEEGTHVEERNIALGEPIRQLDKYDVSIDFGEEVTATVHVWVVPLREPGDEDDLPPIPGEEPAEEPGQPAEADADQADADQGDQQPEQTEA